MKAMTYRAGFLVAALMFGLGVSSIVPVLAQSPPPAEAKKDAAADAQKAPPADAQKEPPAEAKPVAPAPALPTPPQGVPLPVRMDEKTVPPTPAALTGPAPAAPGAGAQGTTPAKGAAKSAGGGAKPVPASPSVPARVRNGVPEPSKPAAAAKAVEAVLSTYATPGDASNMEWLESFTGEVVFVNAAAMRLMVRDDRSRRTKLINFTRETTIQRGDEALKVDSLRLGSRVTVKYEFLDSAARLITLHDTPPTK